MNKILLVGLIILMVVAAARYSSFKASENTYSRGFQEGYEQGKFDQSISCLNHVPYGYPMVGMNGLYVVFGEHTVTGQPVAMMVCPEEDVTGVMVETPEVAEPITIPKK